MNSKATVSLLSWCVASQAFFSRLNQSDWYNAANTSEKLTVDIVDGQQRITTLILVYRVLQHWLNQLQPGHPTIRALRERFHVQSLVGGADTLLLSHDGRGAADLINELIFDDFDFDPKVRRCCRRWQLWQQWTFDSAPTLCCLPCSRDATL